MEPYGSTSARVHQLEQMLQQATMDSTETTQHNHSNDTDETNHINDMDTTTSGFEILPSSDLEAEGDMPEGPATSATPTSEEQDTEYVAVQDDVFYDEVIYSVQKMVELLETGLDTEKELVIFEIQQLVDQCFDEVLDTVLPVICDNMHTWSVNLQFKMAENMLSLVAMTIPHRYSWQIAVAAYNQISSALTYVIPEEQDVYVDSWTTVLAESIQHLDLLSVTSSMSSDTPSISFTTQESGAGDSPASRTSPASDMNAMNSSGRAAKITSSVSQLSATQELNTIMEWIATLERSDSLVLKRSAARLIGVISLYTPPIVSKGLLFPMLRTLLDSPGRDVVGAAIESAASMVANLPLTIIQDEFWPKVLETFNGTNLLVIASSLRSIASICKTIREVEQKEAALHSTSNSSSLPSTGSAGISASSLISNPSVTSPHGNASSNMGATNLGSSATTTSSLVQSANKRSPGLDSKYWIQVITPVFLKQCSYAKQKASLDQRSIDDDTYLFLEVVAEVFGELTYFLWGNLLTAQRKQVLKAYLTMTTCNGPLLRRNCAYNLPGVTYTAKIKYYSELCAACDSLSADGDEETRYLMSAGFHETVKTLIIAGKPDRLFSIYLTLLQDESSRVQMNAVKNAEAMISQFAKYGQGIVEKRAKLLFAAFDFACQNGIEFEQKVAEQLELAAPSFSVQVLRENVLPCLLNLAMSSAAPVRAAAAKAIVVCIRYIPDPDARITCLHSFWIPLKSGSVHTRRAFIHGACAAFQVYSWREFQRCFLDNVLVMHKDPISNIRIALVDLMALMASWHSHSSFPIIIDILCKDSDADVRLKAQRLKVVTPNSPSTSALRSREARIAEETRRQAEEESLWNISKGSAIGSASGALAAAQAKSKLLWPFRRRSESQDHDSGNDGPSSFSRKNSGAGEMVRDVLARRTGDGGGSGTATPKKEEGELARTRSGELAGSGPLLRFKTDASTGVEAEKKRAAPQPLPLAFMSRNEAPEDGDDDEDDDDDDDDDDHDNDAILVAPIPAVSNALASKGSTGGHRRPVPAPTAGLHSEEGSTRQVGDKRGTTSSSTAVAASESASAALASSQKPTPLTLQQVASQKELVRDRDSTNSASSQVFMHSPRKRDPTGMGGKKPLNAIPASHIRSFSEEKFPKGPRTPTGSTGSVSPGGASPGSPFIRSVQPVPSYRQGTSPIPASSGRLKNGPPTVQGRIIRPPPPPGSVAKPGAPQPALVDPASFRKKASAQVARKGSLAGKPMKPVGGPTVPSASSSVSSPASYVASSPTMPSSMMVEKSSADGMPSKPVNIRPPMKFPSSDAKLSAPGPGSSTLVKQKSKSGRLITSESKQPPEINKRKSNSGRLLGSALPQPPSAPHVQGMKRGGTAPAAAAGPYRQATFGVASSSGTNQQPLLRKNKTMEFGGPSSGPAASGSRAGIKNPPKSSFAGTKMGMLERKPSAGDGSRGVTIELKAKANHGHETKRAFHEPSSPGLGSRSNSDKMKRTGSAPGPLSDMVGKLTGNFLGRKKGKDAK